MGRKMRMGLSKSQQVFISICITIAIAIIICTAILIYSNSNTDQWLPQTASTDKQIIPVITTSTGFVFPSTWTPTLFVTQTPRPSSTPIFTETRIVFSTTTIQNLITETVFSKPTSFSTSSDTTIITATPIIQPSSTQIIIPTITQTKIPTKTPVPKVTYECEVYPSVISAAYNIPLTFWVQFSPNSGGLGFDVTGFSPEVGTGQRGCSGVENSSGYASCSGSSGMLASGKTVKVTISTSKGTCTTSYKSN
jgi:hypothetical protein